jgi:hypothetical protein
MNPTDVLVRNLPRQADFLSEFLSHLGIRSDFWLYQLERDDFVCFKVANLVNDPHAPISDFRQNLETRGNT